MSYQVIARKYRPQRFEDVVGQEHVTQTLANAINQNRIAHAYLFVGPRGTGKTTVARIFAKCLNCTGGPKTNFPDDDPRVIEITEGRSLDVLEIDGASNRGIDEVRALRDTVKYAPASSRFKIYIIDEVHMLTKEAFNALLKTLEEPPEHVKFMFATTEPDKVLPTILSRCQRFDLRRIPTALIVKHLAQIAQKEGVKIEEAALHAVARGADGGMRDAESTLDQLISFCGQEVTESDVLSMFGLAAQSQIFALTDAVLAGSTEEALRQLNDLAKQGKELSRIVTELLNHFRNLLIHQVSRGDLSLVEVSEAEAAVLARQSAQISSEAVTRIMEVLADCEGRLRDTTSKKILVEVSLLKMIEARHTVSLDAVLKQLQQLRTEAGGSSTHLQTAKKTVAPAAVSAPVAATTPIPSESPAPAPTPVATPEATAPAVMAPPPAVKAVEPSISTVSPMSPEDLEELWVKLVNAVGQTRAFVRTYLDKAYAVSAEKNVLTIGFPAESADQIGLVDNPNNVKLLEEKLVALGKPLRVKFIEKDLPPDYKRKLPEPPPAEPAPTPTPAPARPKPAATVEPEKAKAKEAKPKEVKAEKAAPVPAAEAKPKESVPFTQDDFKNDPLIQKALEVFKGQIIDVRS